MRKKIWRYILCGVVLLTGLIAWHQHQLSAGVAEEHAFALETSNPTEWVFNEPYGKVKDTIWASFNENRYRGFNISGFDYGLYKFIEKDRLSYFYISNLNPVPSYIYRRNNKGMLATIQMTIYLDSLSENQTRVRANTERYCVNTGRGIVIGGHPWPVPWWFDVWKKVRPSTIEPYEILYKIGKTLGCVHTMPAINYPSELTPREIEHTYYNYNLTNKVIWDPWDGE